MVRVLISAAVMIMGLLLFGGQGLTLAACAVVIGLGGARLGVQQVRTRRSMRARAEVAEACRALASMVRVGRVPSEALATAAVDHAVLEPVERVHRLGGDVPVCLRAQARKPGQSGLLELARAWELTARTGAPLAGSLQQVAEALAVEMSVRQLVAGELAAPRASAKIMAALPVLGIGMGYLLGGDPIQFLLANLVGWLCLLGGVLLAVGGAVWIEELAVRAAEQG